MTVTKFRHKLLSTKAIFRLATWQRNDDTSTEMSACLGQNIRFGLLSTLKPIKGSKPDKNVMTLTRSMRAEYYSDSWSCKSRKKVYLRQELQKQRNCTSGNDTTTSQVTSRRLHTNNTAELRVNYTPLPHTQRSRGLTTADADVFTRGR